MNRRTKMFNRSCYYFLTLMLLVLSFSPLVAHAKEDTSFRQENRPENLKDFLESIHQAIYTKKDLKQAAVLYRSLFPDPDRIRKALKDNVSTDVIEKIMSIQREFGVPNEYNISEVAQADQTIVKVHGATTEEIALYQKDSIPFYEFPGRTKQVAERFLRPNMMFYEAEFVKSGAGSGIKYHLFYWDGKRWTMLGPVWRVLR